MISIIIPTLNEELMIGKCLYQFDQYLENLEIIVVDGGSTDDTVSIVKSFAKVTLIQESEKGRGRQMNRGASVAKGDILLFLHADTLLPPGGLGMIDAAMRGQNVVAGSFYLCFDHRGLLLQLYSWLSKINHVLFTYGVQGLFLPRSVFEEIGGFAEMPLMEDVEVQQRLRRIGRFVKLNHCVNTSSRRFLANGIIRQQLVNIVLVLLYFAGVSPARLKRYYR
jgi:rSAM/selenodomain-associated transferase 2